MLKYQPLTRNPLNRNTNNFHHVNKFNFQKNISSIVERKYTHSFSNKPLSQNRTSPFSDQLFSLNFQNNPLLFQKSYGLNSTPFSIQTRPYAKRRVVRSPRKKKTATATKSESRSTQEEEKNVIDLTPEPVEHRTIENTSEATHLLSQLGENEAIREILMQDSVVITRDIEWGTVLVGFEQANRYCIKDTNGKVLGYIAEDNSVSKTLLRNVTSTHRSFSAHIFDPQGNIILRIRRPFFFLVSQMQIEDAKGNILGEIKQRWHLWRRKYDMFLGKTQFAMVNAPILSIDFDLIDEKEQRLASVNRNFTGFARTIFTDGNEYAVWFKDTSEGTQARDLSLEERAVVLASAVAMDFDYFSHHSGGPGLMSLLPIPIPAPAPVEESTGAGAEGDEDADVSDGAEGGPGLMGDNYGESSKYGPLDETEDNDGWGLVDDDNDNDNDDGGIFDLGDFWDD